MKVKLFSILSNLHPYLFVIIRIQLHFLSFLNIVMAKIIKTFLFDDKYLFIISWMPWLLMAWQCKVSFMVTSLALGQLLPQCQWSNPEGYGIYDSPRIHKEPQQNNAEQAIIVMYIWYEK